MKIKTTFEFSDGTTITLTREQVEELRAALVGPVLPPDTKPLPLETKRDVDRAMAEEILRKQERDAARVPKQPWWPDHSGTWVPPLGPQLYPLWQRPNFGPRMWDGTEWRGTPIPIICEATQ